MIRYQTIFDSGDLGWICLASVVSLLAYLAGVFLVFGSQLKSSPSEAFWRTLPHLAAMLTVAWGLCVYSLGFGPSLGTVPEFDPNPRPMLSLQEMMAIEDAKSDETHLYGRGGYIGNSDYFLMARVIPVPATGQPLFSARRPNYHLPHVLECCLRWSSFLIVVLPLSMMWSNWYGGFRLGLLCLLWSIFVYAPVAHAVAGDGWLEQYGSVDFSIGLPLLASGCSAVLGLSALKTPSTRSTSDRHMAVGILLLWLGISLHVSAYTFHADARSIAALLNMLMGSAVGFLAWSFCNSFLWKRPFTNGTASGMLAGVAAVAPSAGLILTQSALVLGCGAAIVANIVYHRLSCDDETHPGKQLLATLGISSAMGLLGVGLFATTSMGGTRWDGREIVGLIEGNWSLLQFQVIAVGCVSAWSVVASWLLFQLIKPSKNVDPPAEATSP